LARLSRNAVLIGWGIAIAGCAVTILVGWNVLAAHALGGLLELFQVPGTGRHQAQNADLIWPLVPSGLAAIGNAWLLCSGSPRSDGISSWWLAPALLLAVGTFLFGVWVCIDVWPSQITAVQ
jgi:hypothetical protein